MKSGAHHMKGGKGQRNIPNRMEGKKAETDALFMYNMAILVGCPCEITVRDGRKYDGIFCAYDKGKHELLIEAAHLMTDAEEDEARITEHHDVLVVPTDKMYSVRFKSVDVNYATKDFVTDTAISSTRNVAVREVKELTPWEGADGGSDEDLSLDADLTTSKENGWEAKDMFKKNEEKYGVTSSYSHDLSGYTTQIDKTDEESFRRHEQQASQVAQEIEKNTVSWQRTELENGEDEEEAFSAVVRPQRNSNINNNNNNANSGDKYIPPSRRPGNTQISAQSMPQNTVINNNGASQVNNNSNTRKPMYGQSQNPRGYTTLQNNAFHDRRNYDNRRATQMNQYAGSGSSHEPRRNDENPRQQRVPNKSVNPDRRGVSGRDETAKLKEFSSNFRLQQSSEQAQQRRVQNMPPNQPHGNQSQPPNIPPNTSSNTSSSRNPTPPSSTPPKAVKEESPPIQLSVSAGNNKGSPKEGTPTVTTPVSTPSNSSVVSSAPTPSSIESTPASGTSTNDNQAASTADSKNSEADKKKFTFNPNAKEFNPAKSFSSRSPSTPPRPPSTPAQATTPQMMPQPIHSYMQIPMQMLYQPYGQSSALTPSSNSSASSAGATPQRHGNHRKGAMIGPRPDISPAIQMSNPQIIPSIQAAASPHQYTFVPPGTYPHQVMRFVSPPVMPVYSTEGGTSQIHQQMHYIHNGAPTPNVAVSHPSANTPSNTPSVPTSVVSGNSQAYNQGGGNPSGAQLSYPFVGVPFVNVGYSPSGPAHMLLPYVPQSHQGGAAVIPPSQ